MMMKIEDIITIEFSDKVVLDFLQVHASIAEEEEIRNACMVLIPYISAPPEKP